MARRLFRQTLAVVAGVMLAGPPALHAQVATTLEQAELAGLSPEKAAEVRQRMKQPGQTVYEILQTILLNEIKLRFPASRILALDFNRGVAVVQTTDGQTRTVDFDTRTLTIRS